MEEYYKDIRPHETGSLILIPELSYDNGTFGEELMFKGGKDGKYYLLHGGYLDAKIMGTCMENPELIILMNLYEKSEKEYDEKYGKEKGDLLWKDMHYFEEVLPEDLSANEKINKYNSEWVYPKFHRMSDGVTLVVSGNNGSNSVWTNVDIPKNKNEIIEKIYEKFPLFKKVMDKNRR